MQNSCIDQLWLMVSPENPFKVGQEMAAETHRLRMAEMVSSKIDGVIASSFEFSLPRPSYTIDTLNAIQRQYPDVELYLIIGADNWAAFDRWRSHDEIINKFHIIVYPRAGFEVVIPEELQNRVTLVNAPLIEVSSSYIRSQIAQRNNMAFYMPDEVNDYVVQNKLYM